MEMSSPLQFKLSAQGIDPLIFEEVLGDLLLSFWWDEEYLEGVIDEADAASFEERVQSSFSARDTIVFSPVATNWLAMQQELLPPLEAGRFFLYGPQYAGEIPQGKIALLIDSPEAFGSGHHPTTKTCLEEISEMEKPRNVLDVGCGSGILAMACAKLWGCRTVAFDVDAVSVEQALYNMQGNNIEGVSVFAGDSLDHAQVNAEAPYGLILANIHSDTLIHLAAQIAHACAAGGVIVLSGILPEQESAVVQAYHKEGIVLEKRTLADGWCTLNFRKRPAS